MPPACSKAFGIAASKFGAARVPTDSAGFGRLRALAIPSLIRSRTTEKPTHGGASVRHSRTSLPIERSRALPDHTRARSLAGVHAGAIALLLLAVACYLFAWIPGAFLLAFLGILLEVIGWIVLLASGRTATHSRN